MVLGVKVIHLTDKTFGVGGLVLGRERIVRDLHSSLEVQRDRGRVIDEKRQRKREGE
jgi:hypothetical protein